MRHVNMFSCLLFFTATAFCQMAVSSDNDPAPVLMTSFDNYSLLDTFTSANEAGTGIVVDLAKEGTDGFLSLVVRPGSDPAPLWQGMKFEKISDNTTTSGPRTIRSLVYATHPDENKMRRVLTYEITRQQETFKENDSGKQVPMTSKATYYNASLYRIKNGLKVDFHKRFGKANAG